MQSKTTQFRGTHYFQARHIECDTKLCVWSTVVSTDVQDRAICGVLSHEG